MSFYDNDGSWINDPLDIRCIRLDAEMEERAERELAEENNETLDCNDCQYGKGSSECMNCYIGGY